MDELLVRFTINIISILLVTYLVYYGFNKKKNYSFVYNVAGITVFFLCYFLVSVKLELGLALGLFAIFGILRYRTDSLPIKEMTYLFLVIAISVINALAEIYEIHRYIINGSETESINDDSLYLLLGANAVLIAVPLIIELLGRDNTYNMTVLYDDISMATPEKRQELIDDLNTRMGVDVKAVNVQKADMVNGTVKLELKIKKNKKI